MSVNAHFPNFHLKPPHNFPTSPENECAAHLRRQNNTPLGDDGHPPRMFAVLRRPPPAAALPFSTAAAAFDVLSQFLPAAAVATAGGRPGPISPVERLAAVVAVSRAVKGGSLHVLCRFASAPSPEALVGVLKSLGKSERGSPAALAFFKLAVRGGAVDLSPAKCAGVVLVLSSEGQRYLAQDVLACIIAAVGDRSSRVLWEVMWSARRGYCSDFSVLEDLFRGFLGAGAVSPALEVLCRMRSLKLKPSGSGMSILMKLLQERFDFRTVWRLFLDMLGRGPRPTVRTFNTMVLGFCKRGYLRKAVSLLQVMPKYCCYPDIFTCNIVMNAYCVYGRSCDAAEFFESMVQLNCVPNLVTFNTFLKSLCKEGIMVEARRLVDRMRFEGVVPNAFTYNTLIDGYVKAGLVDEANSALQEMIHMGLEPDCHTYNILLVGICKLRGKEEADRFFNCLSLRTCQSSDELAIHVLILKYCLSGQLEEALRLLWLLLKKGNPPDVFLFNAVISGYSKDGLEDDAFDVYCTMVKLGLSPSASTCNSLLMAFCKKKRLNEARDLMDEMTERGFCVSVSGITILIDGYFRAGDRINAILLWKLMEQRGISPDVVAFSALINGFCILGFMDEACEAFDDMLKRGLSPNNLTYNSLIAGFCRIGNLNEAKKLEEDMERSGLLPDLFTKNIFINGWCKQQMMKEASNCYSRLHNIGLIPDIVTYNTLINAYLKASVWDVASQFVKYMRQDGWDLDTTTYNIWIQAHCRALKISEAVKLVDELIWRGIFDTVTYNTIINGICHNTVERAATVMSKIIKMPFAPNVVTVNILLSHFYKLGMTESVRRWAVRLKVHSFAFDNITYKIVENGCHNFPRENLTSQEELIEKSRFFEFLMHITFYLSMYKPPRNRSPVLVEMYNHYL